MAGTGHITLEQMIDIRRKLGFTQPRMADEMGLSKSAYVAVETKAAQFRKIHALAAERIALTFAAEYDRVDAIPYPVAHDLMIVNGKWSRDQINDALTKQSLNQEF